MRVKNFFPTAWHLNRIEMENLKTNERFLFHCGRWLSKRDGDKQIIRELPAQGPGINKPLPVIKYHVDLYTGSRRGAGTDANVFINIFDDIGDTGEYSSTNKNKFERKNVDKFVIEAVSLKQIKKIRIGHDGTGPDAGWFLDKVVVRPEDIHYEEATFICNQWLVTDEDDGLIVRELSLGFAGQPLDKTTYNVT
ncbi:unnamed protein product [Rotaria sp. Silwood2]|nr:unnamed protein product [Rotaria sp. Silwood2]CAF4542225.1 unnamed protein product [Rotaria sp. Silwood2]